MKRKENIEAKPGGNQLAPKTDCEEKKKMVVIFSSKRKIIFSEMDKFKWWILERDVEWGKHINIFRLLNIFR